MKRNEFWSTLRAALKALTLTIQEDDGSGSFVQHVCYGGLGGQCA